MASPKRPVESVSAYRNEQGELCIGGHCFTLRVGDRDEVAIDINEDECSEQDRELVDRVKSKVVSGAPTVYKFGAKK